MTILFLAPRLPLPADTGGKIRTLNILKQLSLNTKVVLLTFAFDKNDELHAVELKNLGIEVHLVPMSQLSVLKKINNLIFSFIPFSINKYVSVPMQEKISHLLKNNAFDAVHMDHLHMTLYMEQCHGIPCTLDQHNVEYKILQRCIPVEKSLIKKLIFLDQALKMKMFERRKLKAVRACFACSKDDQSILTKLCHGKTPIHVIPNGVDTDYFKSTKTAAIENAMVFTGSMDWLPNNDAITYFCTEILPLIWKKNSTIKLYVVGKSPSKAVQKLSQNDNRVIVTNRVNDVRPYVERSKIFIVPLRIGGGTRLKILEAMSMHKAVVSTTIGAEGVEYSSGINIALADTPIHFAEAILDLIDDPRKIAAMEKEGHQLVSQKYDWAIIGKTLNTIYHEVIHGT